MRKHLAILMCAGPLLLFLSCDEQLPAYEDPDDVFVGTLRAWHQYDNLDVATHITLKMVNRFDETLEDTLVLDGSVTMTLIRDQSTRRTFGVSVSNLIYARSFNPATRILRVDPGDSLIFHFRYDYTDDTGRSLLDGVFKMHGDPNCNLRLVSDRELFSISGSGRIFARTSSTSAGSIPFVICYATPFVDKRSCQTPATETSLCP